MTLVPAGLIGDNRPESSPWPLQRPPGPAMRERAMILRLTGVRRHLTPLVLPVVLAGPLALAGCSAGAETSAGQQVQAVAGGGSRDGDGPAGRVRIGGTLRDIDVSDDDVVRVLVDDGGAVIWCIGGDSVDRLEPDENLGAPGQIAATGDGVIYVSAGRSIWQVAADGSTTRVAGNGKRGHTKDGERATSRTGSISGLAVDAHKRVIYAESHGPNTLVRRIERNRIQTLATVPGPSAPATLAAGADGTTYLAGTKGVLAITPTGTIKAVPATGTAPAERPFQPEGQARNTPIEDHGPTHPANLSAEDGNLLLGSWEHRRDHPPKTFRWTGTLSDGQRAIVDAATTTDNAPLTSHIRLIQPNGSITTAARYGSTPVLHEGKIYAALHDPNHGILIAAIDVP